MRIHTALYARDLLRIALDVLEEEQSHTAVAMVAGAINVLDQKAEPIASHRLHPEIVRRHTAPAYCRSCA